MHKGAQAQVRKSVHSELQTFDHISAQLAEIAYHAPRLPIRSSDPSSPSTSPFQKNLTFLFLGRTINQLRSLWLLTINGYTTEAGAICASIIEHAAVVAEIARDPKKAEQLDKAITAAHSKDEFDVKFLPWKYKELFDDIETARGLNEKLISKLYSYACKKKHPSTIDELMTSRSGGDLTAFPDGSTEDLSNKKFVLCVAHYLILIALEAISTHFNWDEGDEYFQQYVQATKVAQGAVNAEMQKLVIERLGPGTL